MKLLKVKLSKDVLLSLEDHQKFLIIALSHVINEINALTKLLYFVSSESDKTLELNNQGASTYIFIISQLLAGKLFETWELLRKNYFTTKELEDVSMNLSEENRSRISKLKRDLDIRNIIGIIRNKFAFHYDRFQIDEPLSQINDPLIVYLNNKDAPNNLFYFSEIVFTQAILQKAQKVDAQISSERIIELLFDVSRELVLLCDSIIAKIIELNNVELRSDAPEELEIENLKDFSEIEIPWFCETTSIIRKQHT
jgi:hypothetical protein